MIVGVGVDMVDIRRMERLILRPRFLSRIFTLREQALAPALAPASFYAKRFAAKEAISKAFGVGIGSVYTFLSIEILQDASRKPLVALHGVFSPACHVSLTDEYPYALAYAIIES